MIAGLIVSDEALRARRHPLDGTAQPPGRPRRDRLLGIVLALVTEPAAHVGRDHPHAAFGDTELTGHDAADEVRDLRGGIEREPALDGVGNREDGARLDGGTGQAVVDQLETDGASGAGERRLDGRRVTACPAKADVTWRVGVEGRRTGRDRGAGAHDGGQPFVIDRHVLGRVGRRRDALGDDHHHRLAHVAHGVACERPAWRLRHGRTVRSADRPETEHRADLVSRHVATGEHGHDSGTLRGARRVDGGDSRVGMRRAHDVTRELAGHGEVRDEAPTARQEARVLTSPDGCADALCSRHRASRAPRGAARGARTRRGR